MIYHRLSSAVVFSILAIATNDSFAGTQIIPGVKPDQKVGIWWVDGPSSGGGRGNLRPDANGNVVINIPESIEAKIKELHVVVRNIDTGKRVSETVLKFTPQISAYEPLRYPLFSSLDGVAVAIAEYPSFATNVLPNAPGQTIAVINGLSPIFQGIDFRDASTLLNGEIEGDFSVFSTLPMYTGNVSIESFGTATPVPEPTTALMLAFGLLSCGMYRRDIHTKRAVVAAH